MEGYGIIRFGLGVSEPSQIGTVTEHAAHVWVYLTVYLYTNMIYVLVT